MTCRQLFYLLVSRGAIAKTEVEYKSTVLRLLKDMRLDHAIPFGWIADNTRWMRKPDTHHSMEAALEETGNLYRRALWRDQPVYVEVWCEKDALAGVLLDVTAKYDVPLMVSRGYASLTYLHETAQALQAQGKPCYLYHFGDHDPSGVDILHNIERRLCEFAPDAELYFEKIAVTTEQIEEFGLLTRPTKKTDTRSSKFTGESVDVDAVPPKQLRALVEECIVQHIDVDLYERSMNIERAERESFSEVMEKMWGG